MNWINPSLLQNRQKGAGEKDLPFSAEVTYYLFQLMFWQVISQQWTNIIKKLMYFW